MAGGGGVPANTTSTTTVNQSPWQNPTYQALALGTNSAPGPVTNLLRETALQSNVLAQARNNPALWYGRASMTPQELATANEAINPSFASDLPQTAAHGGVMEVRGYAKGGKTAVRQLPIKTGGTPKASVPKTSGPKAGGTKQKVLTPEQKQRILNAKKVLNNPKATEAQRQKAKVALQQVETNSGFDVSPEVETGTRPPADPKIQSAVTSVNANYAEAPPTKQEQAAEDYATKSPFAPGDIFGRTAFIDPTTGKSTLPDFLAIQEQARKLGTPETFTQAQDAYKAALAGLPPESWTDAGTADKYMSPYMQQVVDIQKREADRQYQQQMQKLDAQAAGQGAFGGSRHAILEAEAERNQQQLLNDIQAKGQQEAYAAGMGQFGKEQDQATTAYGAMGTMGSGLGALGTGMSEVELAQLRAKGDVAQAQQALAQSALDRKAANAQLYQGLPGQISAAALNAINAQPSTAGTTATGSQQRGATPFAKGGALKSQKPAISPYAPAKTMKKQRGTR
jgi:hypothetical protein